MCWCYAIKRHEEAAAVGIGEQYRLPPLNAWAHTRNHVLFHCEWYKRRFRATDWETLLRELDPFPIIIDFLTDNPGAFTFGDRPLPESALRRPYILPGMHPTIGCTMTVLPPD